MPHHHPVLRSKQGAAPPEVCAKRHTPGLAVLVLAAACGPRGQDTGTPGTTPSSSDPRVDVEWRGTSSTSTLDLTIHDPDGRTRWYFGMAETGAQEFGWYGEDCFRGSDPHAHCHPVSGATLHLVHEPDPTRIVDGSSTLMITGLDLTYYLEDSRGNCWTWGGDYGYYSVLGCHTLSPSGDVWERRSECSGMDPADPAPIGGRVALTFDDGPRVATTPQIVQTLRDHQPNPVPATFFMVGQEVAKTENWAVVQDIVDDPLFRVGNHSYTHANFPELTELERMAELEDTTALLESFGATVEYFRLPGGGGSCDVVDQATSTGMLNTGWHIVTGDYCYAALGADGECSQEDLYRVPPEYEADFVGYVLEDLTRTDGGVVLMHDIHQFTANELEGLLIAIEDAGFTFTTLDDAQAFPNLNAGTPHDFAWIGEACRTDDDHCFEVEYLSTCTATGDPALEPTQGVCATECDDVLPCLDRDGSSPTACAEVNGAGQCLGLSTSLNGYCADVPGTTPTIVPEFHPRGHNVTVCLPTGW